MAFIKPNQNKPSQSQFDKEAASQLAQILRKENRLRAVNISKWAKEFEMLRKTFTEQEIKKVLNWLSQNLKDEYTPTITSAQTFRRKFSALSKAVARTTPMGIEEVGLNDEDKNFIRKLDLSWPGNEKHQIPAYVHESFIQIHLFVQALKNLYAKSRLISVQKTKARTDGTISSADWKETKTIQYLIETMPSPPQLLSVWLSAVHYCAWNYPNWNGNIMSQSFKYKSARFQQMMAKLVGERRGDGSDWIGIWDQLKEFLPE